MFVKFEADSEGRISGHTADGAVIPVGVKLPRLAGRNDISPDEFREAQHIEETFEIRPADE